MLTLPTFQVRQVTVRRARTWSPTSAVVAAAEVPEESIFTINGAAIQSRVLALPWVESAVVTTQLPATVRINIVERAPMLRIRRDGADTLVAANGATLPGIDATPAARSRHPGPHRRPRRVAATAQPAAGADCWARSPQRFPSVFGCSVAAYLWGADDVVSLWTSTGWRAVLGPLDTEAALQLLPQQIETMAALKRRLELRAGPTFGYLDVESPADPVSGGAPGLPAEVRAALLPVAPSVQPPPAAVGRGATDAAADATLRRHRRARARPPATVTVSPKPSPSPSPSPH